MAEIAVTARVFKEFIVEFGADDHGAATASCKFTPNQSVQTWKGGKPSAVFTDMGAPTWTCEMKLAQDWTGATSLVKFLLSNAGTEQAFEFTPVDGGPSFTATLVIAAPQIGGDIDAWGETTVTHGVQGAPVLVPAP